MERTETILHHSFFYVLLLLSCLLSSWIIGDVVFGDYVRMKGESLLTFLAVVIPFLWMIVSVNEIDEWDED